MFFKVVLVGMIVLLLFLIGDILLYDVDIQQEEGFLVSVEVLVEQICNVDGVVIVMLEYNYFVFGGLKNVIDWLFCLFEQLLVGKFVFIQISLMGVIGGVCCQYYLCQILVFFDVMVMNKLEFMGGVIQNKVDLQIGEVVDQGMLDYLIGQLIVFGEFIQWMKY